MTATCQTPAKGPFALAENLSRRLIGLTHNGFALLGLALACLAIPAGANADILREALGSGLTAPSIVTERTIAQLERMLAIRIEAEGR